MHGPQGTGALFVRRGTRLEPLSAGGAHERQRRAGTENVAGIVGLGEAAECAMRNGTPERMRGLRDRLELGLLQHADGVNGAGAERVANTANVWFDGLDGEALVIALDLKGLAVSAARLAPPAPTNPPMYSARWASPQQGTQQPALQPAPADDGRRN